jgi:NADH-quinone oxidoreductase subunit J
MDIASWVAGILAVIAAGCAVLQRNPIYAALFTLVALGGVATEFALMHAPFLAAMQILLYAGAIMVLFVFVIMLLSLKPEEHGDEPGLGTRVYAALVAIVIYVALSRAFQSWGGHVPFAETDGRLAQVPTASGSVEFGSVEHFGHFLYAGSVVPFELVSVLLTAALAAVLVLARKKPPNLDTPEPAPAGHGHGEPSHALEEAKVS